MLLHHDIWWHIAVGDLIRKSGSLPAHDIWSYTAGDKAFYILSWLWDVGFSFLNQHIGLENTLRLQIFIIACTYGLIAAITTRLSQAPGLSLIITIFLLIISFTYMLPDVPLSLSPQTFSVTLAVLWLALTFRLTETNSNIAFILLLIIFTIWVNTHGGFIIALSITGGFGIQALLQKNKTIFIKLLILGIICLLLISLNPLGFDILTVQKSIFNHPSKNHISEWGSFSTVKSIPAYIFVIAGIAGIIFRLRNDKLIGLRIVALLWLFAGYSEKRHMIYFMLFSSPFIVIMLAAAFRRISDLKFPQNPGKSLLLVLSLALVGTIFIWRSIYPQIIGIPHNIYPVKETEFIEKNYPPQKIYNDWNFGSYLIYKTGTKYPIYIDGRSNIAYPDSLFVFDEQFTDEYEKMEAIHAKYDVNLALIRKYPLIKREIPADSKWKKVFEGEIAEIWERE